MRWDVRNYEGYSGMRVKFLLRETGMGSIPTWNLTSHRRNWKMFQLCIHYLNSTLFNFLPKYIFVISEASSKPTVSIHATTEKIGSLTTNLPDTTPSQSEKYFIRTVSGSKIWIGAPTIHSFVSAVLSWTYRVWNQCEFIERCISRKARKVSDSILLFPYICTQQQLYDRMIWVFFFFCRKILICL